jgi:group I intron endonuclease
VKREENEMLDQIKFTSEHELPVQSLKRSGIYRIVSPSGNFYVGSAVEIRKRWRNHKRQLISGVHHNKPLQAAAKKYGLESLRFEIIEHCDSDVLINREQFYIDALRPKYNTCLVAGSPRGVKRSEETKAKVRAANVGRKHSEETKAKLSAAKIGKRLSEDHKAKLSAARIGKIGKKHSEETKAKMSAAHTGKKFSEEHKAKMSAANIGKKHSEEAKAKMSATRTGKRLSEEHKANMSAALTGRKLSEEHKAKLRAARLAYLSRRNGEIGTSLGFSFPADSL